MSRLEEIEIEVDSMIDRIKKGFPVISPIYPNDIKWLIQQAKENKKLKECVEELEDLLETSTYIQRMLRKENRRYKQALEDALWSLKTFESEDAMECLEKVL